MAKNNLPTSRRGVGDSVPPSDSVVDYRNDALNKVDASMDDAMRCANCDGWLADHVNVLWEGEELRLCSGQYEDLDIYNSRVDANRDHALDTARYKVPACEHEWSFSHYGIVDNAWPTTVLQCAGCKAYKEILWGTGGICRLCGGEAQSFDHHTRGNSGLAIHEFEQCG